MTNSVDEHIRRNKLYDEAILNLKFLTRGFHDKDDNLSYLCSNMVKILEELKESRTLDLIAYTSDKSYAEQKNRSIPYEFVADHYLQNIIALDNSQHPIRVYEQLDALSMYISSYSGLKNRLLVNVPRLECKSVPMLPDHSIDQER